MMLKSKNNIFIIIILGIAIFTRFYKLDWGEGYFFHPDERNIVSLTLSLAPPLNLQFFTKGIFAYGNFIPLLTSWINFLPQPLFDNLFHLDTFAFTTLYLRSLSALFSVTGVSVIYLIGRKIWSKKIGILAAIILTFSPGAIQSAHFLTFDSIISTLYLFILYFNIRLLNDQHIRDFFLAILFTAIAAALKINSLILGPLPIFVLFISDTSKIRLKTKFLLTVIGIIMLFCLTIIFSPYYLTKDFWGMLNYEQTVVRGTLDVFYTRSFFETKPIIFQLIKILPFQVNPFVIILSLLFGIIFLFDFIKELLIKKSFPKLFLNEIIILGFFTTLFFPNAFMFSKWNRYMVPVIPYLILFSLIFVNRYLKKLSNPIFLWLTISSLIWGTSFMSIYFYHDTRISASEWIYKNIPQDKKILSETANVIDIPLPSEGHTFKSYQVNNFDFYNLDLNSTIKEKLILELITSDYILIPSRRLFAGMGSFPKKYPLLNRYYNLLFSGKLGFVKIKEFSRLNDEQAEETWSVFDHPRIQIFKKIKPLTAIDYQSIFSL